MKHRKLILHRTPEGGAAAIGIVGSADGPTAYYVAGHGRSPFNHTLPPLARFIQAVVCICALAASLCALRRR